MNKIINSILAVILFFVVSLSLGVCVSELLSLKDVGIIIVACSLLCGVIVFCTYIIIDTINSFKEQVYELKRQTKVIQQQIYVKDEKHDFKNKKINPNTM